MIEMRSRTVVRSARRNFGSLFVGLLLLSLAGVTIIGLRRAGFFGPRKPSYAGLVPCPATARPLTAYAAVAKEDLVDAKTLQIKVAWLPPEVVGKDVLRDISQIVGRVAARDKALGMVFTERDFLPKGTRPGVAAGVPPGKRALTIPAEKVTGLELLRQGDRFDLVVALPSQASLDQSNVEYAVLLGGIKPMDTRAGQLARQTGVRTLAKEGTMVALVQGKHTSTSGKEGLVVPSGNRTTKATEVQAVIAISPEEVNRVSEAMGQDLKIFCVAHSGHAESASHQTVEPSLEGMIAVPAPVNRLVAFSAITQEDLADSVTGKLNVYYFPLEKIAAEWKTDFTQLIGRVVNRDVEPGTILTENDLLPPGTRPGPSAGAPPGMVVVQVPSERIQGLQGLARGDRFAIHAQLPQQVRPAFEAVQWAMIAGGQLSPEDLRLQEELQTGIRVVTNNAVLVMPAKNRTEGTTVATCSIAIPQGEAISLRQYLQLEEPLTAVIHSNQMAEPESPVKLEAHESLDQPVRSVSILPVAWQRDAASGMVPVPITARPLKPFARIQAEDFIDPATGKIRLFYFPESKVKKTWVTDVSALLDRIVTHEIEAGRVIQGSDLLPEGTRPGVVAGVGPGEVAISIDDRLLRGLKEAHVGDIFTVMGTRPFSPQHQFQSVRQPLPVDPQGASVLGSGTLFDQASVNILAENVRLISIGVPREIEETRTVTRVIPASVEYQGDKIVRASSEATYQEPQAVSVTVQEYVIAISPQNVALLGEAIVTRTPMQAVLRSSHPAEQQDEEQRELRPTEAVPGISQKDPLQAGNVIEHIRGNAIEREFWLSSTNPETEQKNAVKP